MRKISKEAVERLAKYQFVPGDPRINRGGRPAGRSISSALRTLLSKPYPRDKQRRSYAEMIARALCSAAVKGSVEASRLIADRVEGGIRSHLEIEIEDRSHSASLTLDSFRTLSDAELNERLERCNQVLKRTAPKVQ